MSFFFESKMSLFLSPSTERTFCFLVDKLETGDWENSGESQEKVEIWVSKELLAVASPVFKTMFYGDFRESQSSATEPLYLPGKNDRDFLKFLDCLFPYSTQSDIDESNVEAILRLSDEYQVEYLFNKCDQFYDTMIKSLYVGRGAILYHLPIILKYKLKRSIATCVSYVAALNARVISNHRAQNSSAMKGYHQFYSAVYEAKLSRISHEEHFPKHSKCRKCGAEAIGSITDPPKCLSFHRCSTKSSNCVCGYEFKLLYLYL